MGNRNRAVTLGVTGLLSASLIAVAAPVAAQDEVSPEWQAVLDEANGQTVNWFMWGGSDRINSYVSDWVGAKAAEQGVTINRVPLTDTVDAVNTVLGEKQAGVDEDGAVDMIWINGENFRTGKQADLYMPAALAETRDGVEAGLWTAEGIHRHMCAAVTERCHLGADIGDVRGVQGLLRTDGACQREPLVVQVDGDDARAECLRDHRR